MNLDEINIGSLAYLGDSVYEVMIRKHLILGSKEKSNILQKKWLAKLGHSKITKITASIYRNDK